MAITKKKDKYTRNDWPKQWIGINPNIMRPYRKYINNEKPGYCGTYTVAVLLHYKMIQDYQVDLSMEELLGALKPLIDGRYFYKGTYPWDLTQGLRDFIDTEDYEAKWHLISNPIVVEQLSKKEANPVIVGTTKLLGSRYGNHWLVVYAYGYNDKGQLFYKAYDNHGKINSVIAASQTMAAVWLERKEQRNE
ncbi:dihydrolipoamide dehydrogenase [Aerococcaceae bacterium WGS1372]